MMGVLLKIALALLALGMIAPPAASSSVKRLGNNLYAFISDNDSSSNSVFLVGPESILVVDTGFDGKEAAKLLAAIRTVSSLPVQYIVNTHYHRDHQAGNGIVGPGATVISTEWTRERTVKFVSEDLPRMEARLTGSALESLRSTRYRPATETFTDRLTLHLGDNEVDIYYPGKAHTLGDAVVYFSPQRVVATGDLFLNNSSPAMDEGSVMNWIKALEALLARPIEYAVPGHFEVATKSGLQRFHDYLADLRDQVAALVTSGASLSEVRERIDMSKYRDFRQYPRFGATFKDNAEAIFNELSQKRPPARGMSGKLQFVGRIDACSGGSEAGNIRAPSDEVRWQPAGPDGQAR